jgi:hypothetical protein
MARGISGSKHSSGVVGERGVSEANDSFEVLICRWGHLRFCNVYIRHKRRPDYRALCAFIDAHCPSSDASPLVAGDFNWPALYPHLCREMSEVLGLQPLLVPQEHAARESALLEYYIFGAIGMYVYLPRPCYEDGHHARRLRWPEGACGRQRLLAAECPASG